MTDDSTVVDISGNDFFIDSDSDSSCDSGFDWIQQQDNLQNVHSKYIPETIHSISVFCVYINQHKYIEKIISEKIPCIDCSYGSLLPKETILKIIQTKKIKTPVSKYKFQEALSFFIDLDSNDIQTFTHTDEHDSSRRFYKVLSFTDDVFFKKSISIFHDIHSLFFIFQEVSTHHSKHTLKSILVQRDSAGAAAGTKKVRIFSRKTTRKMHDAPPPPSGVFP
jgi:hypothetical protein